MSIKFDKNKTIFVSKSTLSCASRFFIALISIIVTIGGIYIAFFETPGKINNKICLFMFLFYWLDWVFTGNKGKIIIDENNLFYNIKKLNSNKTYNYQILLSSISQIELSADRCFIILDSDNNQDYTINLEYFEQDEVQMMINILAKKVLIKIDEKITAIDKIILPSFALQKEQKQRRRKMIEKTPVSSDIHNKNIVNYNRNLELEKNNNEDDSNKFIPNRRIEL